MDFTNKVSDSTAQGAAAPGRHRKQWPADLWTNMTAEWEFPACIHMNQAVSLLGTLCQN